MSRSKGRRGEQQVVRLARAHGLQAERTWHLAQSPVESERCCDVQIAGQSYQVQISADGFGRIYQELEGVQGFFFRRDHGEWLVALRATDFLRLLEQQQ